MPPKKKRMWRVESVEHMDLAPGPATVIYYTEPGTQNRHGHAMPREALEEFMASGEDTSLTPETALPKMLAKMLEHAPEIDGIEVTAADIRDAKHPLRKVVDGVDMDRVRARRRGNRAG